MVGGRAFGAVLGLRTGPHLPEAPAEGALRVSAGKAAPTKPEDELLTGALVFFVFFPELKLAHVLFSKLPKKNPPPPARFPLRLGEREVCDLAITGLMGVLMAPPGQIAKRRSSGGASKLDPDRSPRLASGSTSGSRAILAVKPEGKFHGEAEC